MIHALLQGRLLGGGGAGVGAPVASPAYPAMLATAIDEGAPSATAAFSLSPDGSWTQSCTTLALGGHDPTPPASGLWFSPETPGVGSGYEALITATLNSGSAPSITNHAAAWTSLGSALELYMDLTCYASDTTIRCDYTINVQIRIAGGGSVVSTGSFDLSMFSHNSSPGGPIP